MFFRSAKSQILAIILILVGCFQLFWGLSYMDAARRELSAVGKISHVDCGRGCTYMYDFTINGVKVIDQSNTCKTPLSALRCKEGAPVLVYYDPEHISISALQEFGAASRGRLFLGTWMVGCGLLLVALYHLLQRMKTDQDESEPPDQSENKERDEVLHIAP